MMAADKDGNGLIEYPGTGNFGDRPLTARRPVELVGHHQLRPRGRLRQRVGIPGVRDVRRPCPTAWAIPTTLSSSPEKAAKLRAAYAPAFLDPATGVLAGWKSADGQLHDYWFTFVQGVAVTYGLLDRQTANGVMDRLLAKFKEAGYTRFDIGLPGNLVPIKKGDYVYEKNAPEATGEPATGRWQRRLPVLRKRRRDRLLELLHHRSALSARSH